MDKIDALKVSLLILLLLVVIKLLGFYFTASGLLLADATHSLIDMFPTLATFLAFVVVEKYSRKREFPYGLYKLENLLALFIAGVIFLAVFEAIMHLNELSIVNKRIIPFVVASLIVELVLFVFQRNAAEKSGSEALLALSTHTLSDVGSTIAIGIVGLIENATLAKLLLIAIVLIVVKETLGFLLNSIKSLLDISVRDDVYFETERRIKRLLPSGFHLKELILRKSGSVYLGEVIVEVGGAVSLSTLDAVRKKILKSLPERVKFLRVYFEPKRLYRSIAIPVKEGKLSERFGEAEEIVLIDVESGRGRKIPVERKEVKRGYTIAKKLSKVGADCVVVKGIGEIAKAQLLKDGIAVVSIEELEELPEVRKAVERWL